MPTSPSTKAVLTIDELRKIDPEMPAQVAAVFFTIAEKPGIGQQEAAKLAGLTKSAISRIFIRLSTLPGGLGLVRMEEDPVDRRNKVADLTPLGRRVVNSVERILER